MKPSHHLLYLFALFGDRTKTEENVRQVMNRAYGSDFFAGDEDNGEQGAWFVLSALGLYSVAPGTPDYVLGSPIFKHVAIDRSGSGESEKLLHIVALGASAEAVRVKSVYFAGDKIPKATVSDLDLAQGGILQFVMESEEFSTPVNIKSLLALNSPSRASGDLKNEIAAKELEVKNHRGMEEFLQNKLDTLEQAQRVNGAGLPCSLHREQHNLLHNRNITDRGDSKAKLKGMYYDPDIHSIVSGGKTGAFSASASSISFSNSTLVIFSVVVVVLIFLLWASALADGLTLFDYILRAVIIAGMLIEGAPMSDLKARFLNSRKPVAHTV